MRRHLLNRLRLARDKAAKKVAEMSDLIDKIDSSTEAMAMGACEAELDVANAAETAYAAAQDVTAAAMQAENVAGQVYFAALEAYYQCLNEA